MLNCSSVIYRGIAKDIREPSNGHLRRFDEMDPIELCSVPVLQNSGDECFEVAPLVRHLECVELLEPRSLEELSLLRRSAIPDSLLGRSNTFLAGFDTKPTDHFHADLNKYVSVRKFFSATY